MSLSATRHGNSSVRIERPLRIAFVVNQLALGGAERQAVDVGKGLAARGHRCTFFSFYGRRLLEAELNDSGIELVPLDAGRTYWRGVPRLARELREGRVDVVHSYMSIASSFCRIAARLASVPMVTVQQAQGDHHPFCVRLADRLTLNLSDAVICSSRAVQQTLQRRTPWGLRSPPSFVVYNTVDVDRLETQRGERAHIRQELGIGERDVVFTYVGRYVAEKAQVVLIDAFPTILDVEPCARLVLVGWGPLREQLEARACTLGVRDRVVFAIERSDAPAVVAASDVVLFPSRSEGFGIALVEAMALGVPVAATRIAPLTEIVRDGVDGLLVAPGEAGGFARAALALAHDAALRHRLVESARARVYELFDVERAVLAYEQVLTAVARGAALEPYKGAKRRHRRLMSSSSDVAPMSSGGSGRGAEKR